MSTVPVPPDSSYLGELFAAAQRAFLDALMASGEMLGLSTPVIWGIAILVAALAVFFIGRLVLARMRAGSRRDDEAGVVAVGAASSAFLDAAAWRAELERRLAEGRIPEALEAAWWWLARSVAGEKAEPDWTSRDLMARARRPALVPLVRRLDAFIYGPRQPAAEELRTLVGRMEETLS